MLLDKQRPVRTRGLQLLYVRFLAPALAAISFILLISGCNPGQLILTPTREITTPLPSPTQSTTPLPVIEITPSPTHIRQTPTPEINICSPLSDFELQAMNELIVNPYTAPPPGSDMPHEGIDLAVVLPQTGIAIEGNPVQAVLPGRVSASLNDRFPYGNALIIETPLSELPAGWVAQLMLPEPIPTLPAHPALTCPTTGSGLSDTWQLDERSLYLVYAHLKEAPDLKTGHAVACGDKIGIIGATGNALNPHLHLEARVGPSGVRFTSMTHYDSRATSQEMEAYCLWRVSGWFLLVDPLKLLDLQG